MKESNSNNYPAPAVIEAIRYFGITVSKLFWRMKFHGTENIPQNLESGLLIVPNHQSYFDPFWICIPIRRKFRFMAWDKAFEWFLVGDMIRYLGAFPVNLERGSKESLKQAVKALREGATLVIFPEGGIFQDGEVHPIKPGLARLAIQAELSKPGLGVKIVPMSIRYRPRIPQWGSQVKIAIGSAISVADYAHCGGGKKEARVLTAEIEKALKNLDES